MEQLTNDLERILFPLPEGRPLDWHSCDEGSTEEEETGRAMEDIHELLSDVDWSEDESLPQPVLANPANPPEIWWSSTHDYVARPVRATPDFRHWRKRLRSKTPSMEPPQLVPAGYLALCPCPLNDNRLARDLGALVYVVAFGCRGMKPQTLQPLEFETALTDSPPLFCVNAKEDGHTYYAAEPLAKSATARHLLGSCSSVEQAYARMVLLRSPSWSVLLPEDFLATPALDFFWGGIAVTDGQSEVSAAFAKRIGLLPQDAGPDNPCLYSPWQVRGTVPTTSAETCFIKAMLTVNLNQSHDMNLRKECRKVSWPTRASAGIGRSSYIS